MERLGRTRPTEQHKFPNLSRWLDHAVLQDKAWRFDPHAFDSRCLPSLQARASHDAAETVKPRVHTKNRTFPSLRPVLPGMLTARRARTAGAPPASRHRKPHLWAPPSSVRDARIAESIPLAAASSQGHRPWCSGRAGCSLRLSTYGCLQVRHKKPYFRAAARWIRVLSDPAYSYEAASVALGSVAARVEAAVRVCRWWRHAQNYPPLARATRCGAPAARMAAGRRAGRRPHKNPHFCLCAGGDEPSSHSSRGC